MTTVWSAGFPSQPARKRAGGERDEDRVGGVGGRDLRAPAARASRRSGGRALQSGTAEGAGRRRAGCARAPSGAPVAGRCQTSYHFPRRTRLYGAPGRLSTGERLQHERPVGEEIRVAEPVDVGVAARARRPSRRRAAPGGRGAPTRPRRRACAGSGGRRRAGTRSSAPGPGRRTACRSSAARPAGRAARPTPRGSRARPSRGRPRRGRRSGCRRGSACPRSAEDRRRRAERARPGTGSRSRAPCRSATGSCRGRGRSRRSATVAATSGRRIARLPDRVDGGRDRGERGDRDQDPGERVVGRVDPEVAAGPDAERLRQPQRADQVPVALVVGEQVRAGVVDELARDRERRDRERGEQRDGARARPSRCGGRCAPGSRARESRAGRPR